MMYKKKAWHIPTPVNMKRCQRLLVTANRGFSSSCSAFRAAKFNASKVQIEQFTGVKAVHPNRSELGFGNFFSSHMLSADWTEAEGWGAPRIHTTENISLHPSALVFHYGLECFEGMKVYRGIDGKIRMFRPSLNIARFNRSCSRLALPTIEDSELLKALETLVLLDADSIPEGRGYSMYLRPTMIATTPVLGVSKPQDAKLFVLTSPCGAYYSGGFRPVRLLADARYTRAWPGGVGDTKCGGNYAPTIMPAAEAAAQGFDQLLWLFGDDNIVTEAGTSNFFVHWKNTNGEEEIVTAPLDGTILEGVTRQSIIDLVTEWGDVKLTERLFTMKELECAVDEGRVREMFSCGTAATVTPVQTVGYNDRELIVPFADGQAGPLAHKLTDAIFDIQYGVVEHEWAPLIN